MRTVSDRRSFLGIIFGVATWMAAMPVRLQSQQPAPHPPFPGQKPGDPDPDLKPDIHGILKENQKNIKKNVERLFELAEELKKEVEKTDAADVLSLQMVRKAEEIEKLARQIKNLARG